MTLGIDFDNTLADYGDVLRHEAVSRGLVPADAPAGKKNIRDIIRRLPDGETAWQKLQAVVYGPRMKDALMFDGVKEFMRLCRDGNVRVYVVSHKAQRYPYDESGTDFRAAALSWMDRQGFFDELGLSKDAVHFEDARASKVARIARLGCSHFIDDLEETFLEPGFPGGVEKILYAPNGERSSVPDVRVLESWKEVRDHLFHGVC